MQHCLCSPSPAVLTFRNIPHASALSSELILSSETLSSSFLQARHDPHSIPQFKCHPHSESCSLSPPPVPHSLSVHCFTTLGEICCDFGVLFSCFLATRPLDAQLHQDKNCVCFVHCGMYVLIILPGSCFYCCAACNKTF